MKNAKLNSAKDNNCNINNDSNYYKNDVYNCQFIRFLFRNVKDLLFLK